MLDYSRLGARLAAVAPIHSVDVGRKTIQFDASATAEQRAAAQAILDNWSESDALGTVTERRQERLEEIAILHAKRGGVVDEKTFWEGQPNSPKKTAVINLCDAALAFIDNRITTIRGQM